VMRQIDFPFRRACAALLVAGAAALAACSSSPPLFTSDGRQTTAVQCPVGSDTCEQQAKAMCGNGGYDVVRESSDNGMRSLLYACRRQSQY
jgi:hypothetical protein